MLTAAALGGLLTVNVSGSATDPAVDGSARLFGFGLTGTLDAGQNLTAVSFGSFDLTGSAGGQVSAMSIGLLGMDFSAGGACGSETDSCGNIRHVRAWHDNVAVISAEHSIGEVIMGGEFLGTISGILLLSRRNLLAANSFRVAAPNDVAAWGDGDLPLFAANPTLSLQIHESLMTPIEAPKADGDWPPPSRLDDSTSPDRLL